MRKLKATRQKIPASFFPQHEIDAGKVDALVRYIRAGGSVPPVVVARYGDTFMPIDGHHRLAAAERIGCELDAWVVSGEAFEALDRRCRDRREFDRAEDFVSCDGVPAMMVAPRRRQSSDHGQGSEKC